MITRLTENVYIQDEASVGELDEFCRMAAAGPDIVRRANSARLTHAVNFYAAGAKESLIQGLTAESMARARVGNPAIRLLAVVQTGEEAAVPASFTQARPLTRVVTDLKHFQVPRPLPLLFDVLECAADAAAADDYLVFTNSDICVQPQFYLTVQSLLRVGVDALIVNRRTVGALESYGRQPESAANENGARHPGFDCFLFPAAWVRGFARGESCLGAGWVMRTLLYNMAAAAQRMLILRDVRLTYHYGDDATWRDPRLADYVEYNLDEARRVYRALLERGGIGGRRLEEFARAHQEPVATQAAPLPAKARGWLDFLIKRKIR